ncbi:thiamine pyrophosphokinase [Cantharellus anzutake]|uniref:thiamine pyrophosphokinase n=1 Tax=Cantharellus anzutake TaxID=1750568 RepID=UPI0019035C94|nr:thiamine pyrophosphokinase [Cantharellus anzutake]KAF8332638.1 thiamine pyrophosphokinase [Cantharellus anzutake]
MNHQFWSVPFLSEAGTTLDSTSSTPWALIILNQPFSKTLLDILWPKCAWKACADGGANRLYDVLPRQDRASYLPDLVKGDLDSVRDEVKLYYTSKNVPVEKDEDVNATDLMKCVASLHQLEELAGGNIQYNIILLGGLSGRLDQTIHTLSYLHKQRRVRPRIMAITDDSLAWVLDEGEHTIAVDSSVLGKTCGILPVGVQSTTLTLKGFEWNLEEEESSFDGLVSTSNHVIEGQVYIKTTSPVCWTVAVKEVARLCDPVKPPTLYEKAISWCTIM